MRRSLGPAPFLLAGLALACELQQPTGPAGSGQSTIEEAAALPAAVVTTTTAIDQAGDVGWFTSLASGSDGRQHITYRDVTNADLKYATCVSGCGSASNWSRGVIDQVGNVGQHSSLKLGADGRRHVAYRDADYGDLRYATCAPAANCTLAAKWTKVRIDVADDAGLGSAIALGPDGRRHVSHLRRRVGPAGETMALRYASCPSACGQPANWTKVTVDEGPNSTSAPDYFLVTSIAIGRDGRRHITYLNAAGSDLRYATCLSNCANPAGWQKVTIDEGAQQIGFHSSLAIGLDGVLHVSYFDRSNADLKYARCALDCTKAGNWTKVRVAATNEVGPYTSLAVESSGRVHVSALDGTNSALYYATCAAGCTTPFGWTRTVLDDGIARVGLFTSLTARGGVVRISYYDLSRGDLRFLTRTPLINPF